MNEEFEIVKEKENEKQTNADRMRSMTDDELSEFLVSMKTEYVPCMVGD